MKRPRYLRWGEAERYFVKRMGDSRFTYRLVDDPERSGLCFRCGRHADKGHKSIVVHCQETGEILEYGVSCWPDQMLMELRKAIRRETDAVRKARMIENLERFCSSVEDQGLWSEGYKDPKKRMSQISPSTGSGKAAPRKKIIYVVTDVFNKTVRTFDFQHKEEAIRFAETMELRGKGKHFVRQSQESIS